MQNALPRAPDVPAPVTNADKARALIAMLEGGAGKAKGDISEARLRDWARDLVETVEKSATPAPSRDPAPMTAPPPRADPPRLFTRAAPVLTAEPAAPRPPAARLTLGAPMPHVPATPASRPVARPAILSRDDVTKLVAATVDPASLSREHPAIVAMTLAGKPSLEQAAALRALPGGQMRAVHRALRQLEAQ